MTYLEVINTLKDGKEKNPEKFDKAWKAFQIIEKNIEDSYSRSLAYYKNLRETEGYE